ncbi:universal stress protein [Salinimicrobium xinjiangense]|uniref:universal stress protein n=1 Tax=Salinimicrobium xinjiangense TaxID=438596 RepID=UPI000409BC35|nr:universal stress protein [Salinimicrobium xinjiangense]
MNVLLLSDFSKVAINATLYAMDLLQDQKVNFYLLNIYDPDPDCEDNREHKRIATQARLEERVQKLKQRSATGLHKITGHYSEDTLVNAARRFVDNYRIDLIVMGAVGHEQRHTTILGRHTFEIIYKIKCNILAVPENSKFKRPGKLLMPLDYTASFSSKNIRFLKNSGLYQGTDLNIWEISGDAKIADEEIAAKKNIFSSINDIKVKFSPLMESAVYNANTWTEVQKKFDHIILLGKNIRICDRLLHNQHGLYTSVPNQIPILVLHD